MTDEIGRSPVSVMHVCGSHEQAIAKFGLRAGFPKNLNVIMGPGCPVCITDLPEVDEGVALARQGVMIASYGDMLKVPGTVQSLAAAQAEGARVEVVYSAAQAVELARQTEDEVVFFATGFETTAVATAAVVKGPLAGNFSVLSAHKYIPPVMEIVAEMPETRVEGFLAAGHAAAITGWGIFESFVEKHGIPVVVAGFEPLDILAGLAKLVELIRDRTPRVVNMFPRCVTQRRQPARPGGALERLQARRAAAGAASLTFPNGNLRLRDEWAHVDARRRFSNRPRRPLGLRARPRSSPAASAATSCRASRRRPTARLFGKECVPDTPVGACMVSCEGTCKIWHQYGGHSQPRRAAVKIMTVLEERITLKQGAGGRAMRALIEDVFLNEMPAPPAAWIGAEAMDDGAALRLGDRYLVVTTDSHVVQPIFFPGGDIGRLSVSGTVNDLAMMGATEPLALTCAAVLEEGFPSADLERIQESIRETCREAGAPIVTGDTKVMGRGELDGIVLNTTGIALTDRVIPDSGLRPGDRIVVTGSIGDHGFAILAIRHGLDLVGDLMSDVAPLNGLIREAIRAAGDSITAMKDPTRGGLSSALHEMAGKGRGRRSSSRKARCPSPTPCGRAADLLGIDPLHVANEGKAVFGIRREAADRVLEALRAHPLGRNAAIVGTVVAERPGNVILDTGFGRRLLSEPEGELLPRIC